MKTLSKTTILLIVLVFQSMLCQNIKAQDSLQQISIHRKTGVIKIDGALNEVDWKSQLQTFTFIQSAPNNGKQGSQKTEVAVLYDYTYLYVSAKLHVTDRSEINTILTARDDLGNSDFFGLGLDPFGLSQDGYEFLVTSAGVQFDQKISNDDNYPNFNVVWESKVIIADDQWTVEMKIPFNSIRFPKEELSNLRINFQRFSAFTNEDTYWNHIDIEQDGFLNQFGRGTGMSKIQPPLNLSFIPFTSVFTESNPFSDGRATQLNVGMDMKYVYDNSYTLDVSLIPDFSQAPSDNQVLNLSPFEIQFNENRQFFVEGTELFDKGGYFYSRRIGGRPLNSNVVESQLEEGEEIIENPISSNILNLIKFTGKSENGFSIGVLNGITNTTYATVENNETRELREVQTNPLSNYNAVVLDQTLKNNSSITFLNNSVLREGNDYDANLSALLFTGFNKKRSYSLKLRAALSQQYSSGVADIFGQNYYAALEKISGTWNIGIRAELHDDTFDSNDFGFLPRNNRLNFTNYITYKKFNPEKTFNYYQLRGLFLKQYYYSLMEEEVALYDVEFFGQLKNNMNLIAGVQYREPSASFFEARTPDQPFNRPAIFQTFLEVQTNSNKLIYFASYLETRNYTNSDTFTYSIDWGYGLTANIGQHLSVTLDQSLEYMDANHGYMTRLDGQVLIGKRNIQEWSNQLQISYVFNLKLSTNLRLRHYWSQVNYMDQFSLAPNGNLQGNDLAIVVDDFDTNYNNFLGELSAKWQFAPASELSFFWRYGTESFTDMLNSNYGNNLANTLNTDNSSTISLKMTYFLDFNQMRSKKGGKNRK